MPQADAPITFVVPGVRYDGPSRSGASATPLPASSGPGQVKARVQVAARRSGDAVRVTAVPGEDLVLLHIAGGPVLTLHPATAAALMRGQDRATRGAEHSAGRDESEVQVSARLRWQDLEQAAPSRSGGFLGQVLLSAFEVVTGLVRDKAVDFVASAVVHKVDGQVEAGVYELSPETLTALKGSGRLRTALPAPASPATQPLLVLIHGTFVDTVSTFGKMWVQHPQAVHDLFTHYGQRVYALDHPTLGASPIANALTLVQALPDGVRLHLVTHSRGGLVAEVLARVCARPVLSADDLAHFADPAYEGQRRELRALAQAVKKKGIAVERVLRVACPARGTLLASQRLDAYLSVLRWTLELAAVPVAPTLLEFLAEVARRRADPAELPGLAAMIPDAPLLNWLNGTEEPIAGDLRVIAGDLQGDSVGTWLKTLLADAFYWTDNDIVVHTRSMYGGAPRAGGAQFLLDQGGKVTHFAYFANERSVQAVVAGLTQSQPPGFDLIGPLSWAGRDSSGSRAARASRDGRPASERPAVFVLPGILGSHLRVGDERIWLSLRLIGGLGKLRYEPGRVDGVQPDGPIGLSYDDLIEHLADSHEVLEFSYDWRRPIEEEARRLAEAVVAALDARNATGQPVRLLAHSMGGVVARTMQLERPQVWARLMQRPGARLVMLGTPNGGSWAPMQCLSGDDSFGNALASFGSPLRDRQARQWMAEMPGFIQLQAGLLDQGLDQESQWRELAEADLKFVQDRNWWHTSSGESPEAAYAWGVPPQRVLDQARALRERLDRQRDGDLKTFADRLALVVGRAKFTPDGYTVGEQGLVYQDAVDGGDGRVTLESALLPGVRTWTLDTEHGSLPDKQAAFEAFVELLERGDTARLSLLATQPVAGQRGGAAAAAATATPRVVHVASRPSRARSLPLPAMGQKAVFLQSRADDGALQRPRSTALQVAVLNGNLSFVRTPLMVGHSRSLILTGTEAAVNRLVGGAMKASLEAGLYPDEPGSHQIFMNTRQDPGNPWAAPRPGAVVVVGLGDEGKLSEERLTRSVRQGVMAWAQRQAEAPAGAPAHIELAATLIGSGGSGMNASNAARAIAQGVRDANLRLEAGNIERGWPVVTKLTLVELYLERASDAWHGLQVLATAAPGNFDIAPTIASGVGPLRRQIDSGYRGTDYDFITATSAGDDTIAFTLDTRRARTEVRAQSTQGRLLRELVGKASRDGRNGDGDAQLGRTLFQLLVPHEVEPFLSGTGRMLLELDEKTAPIPWELLETQSEHLSRPGQGAERPWAIRTQLLRKLRKDSYRQQVQDASPDDSVLVVGEPLITDDRYARLPGAEREARAVARQLGETGAVPPDRINALLDQPSASQVINALFERCYRIVHIAGHGEPVLRDEKDRSKIIHKGGVVLSDGTFLGPDEVRSMRTVPELVFVNCCHLAAPDEQEALKARRRGPFDRADFAYGLADALIETGVRCVIAAGWAVDDEPAEIFATTFYAQLLNRQPFITAVARAREAAWLADPRSNTWAAYQCYGDPNWTYRQSATDALATPVAAREEFDGVASPLALVLALEEVVVQHRYMGAEPAVQLEKVRHLEARFASLWGSMGAVAEAFALGYQEAGDADSAIAWYERAVIGNDGSASMKAQEELGQLRAHRAWDRLGRAAAGQRLAVAAQAQAEISQAVHDLSLLASLLPTLQRHSLVGWAHQRLALIDRLLGKGAAEQQQLQAAGQAYRAASSLARQQGQTDLFRPALNALAVELVLQNLPGPGRRARLDIELLEAARHSLQHKALNDPDFSCHAGLIEIDLLQALAGRRLKQAAAGLLDRYAELHTRVGSRSCWTAVADQGDFLLTPHARRQGGAEAAAAALLLAWLNERAGRGAAPAA